jgi:hypothetical protein
MFRGGNINLADWYLVDDGGFFEDEVYLVKTKDGARKMAIYKGMRRGWAEVPTGVPIEPVAYKDVDDSFMAGGSATRKSPTISANDVPEQTIMVSDNDQNVWISKKTAAGYNQWRKFSKKDEAKYPNLKTEDIFVYPGDTFKNNLTGSKYQIEKVEYFGGNWQYYINEGWYEEYGLAKLFTLLDNETETESDDRPPSVPATSVVTGAIWLSKNDNQVYKVVGSGTNRKWQKLPLVEGFYRDGDKKIPIPTNKFDFGDEIETIVSGKRMKVVSIYVFKNSETWMYMLENEDQEESIYLSEQHGWKLVEESTPERETWDLFNEIPDEQLLIDSAVDNGMVDFIDQMITTFDGFYEDNEMPNPFNEPEILTSARRQLEAWYKMWKMESSEECDLQTKFEYIQGLIDEFIYSPNEPVEPDMNLILQPNYYQIKFSTVDPEGVKDLLQNVARVTSKPTAGNYSSVLVHNSCL